MLLDSGIDCDASLFVDPVLCVAAEMENCRQDRELPMPFAVQMNGYIISPYFDHLSFFFNREWRHKAGNIYSLMIKLADDAAASLTPSEATMMSQAACSEPASANSGP